MGRRLGVVLLVVGLALTVGAPALVVGTPWGASRPDGVLLIAGLAGFLLGCLVVGLGTLSYAGVGTRV